MNNKYLPSLITGFAAGVLLSVPVINSFGFLLFVPWGVYFALTLHIKLNNGAVPVKVGTAILFGFLTAIWSAFFSTMIHTLLTLLTHSNNFVEGFYEEQKSLKNVFSELAVKMKDPAFSEMANVFLGIYKKMYNDIKSSGFSALYTFMVLFGMMMIQMVLGVIGGLISRIFINKRYLNK